MALFIYFIIFRLKHKLIEYFSSSTSFEKVVADSPLPVQSSGAEVLRDLKNAKPLFWLNPNRNRSSASLMKHLNSLPLQPHDLERAEQLWENLRPVFTQLFGASAPHGRIISPLVEASAALGVRLGLSQGTRLFIKQDNHLAVCGSVKARGGLFETFAFADRIARSNHTSLIDTMRQNSASGFKLSDYEVVVGSTGTNNPTNPKNRSNLLKP